MTANLQQLLLTEGGLIHDSLSVTDSPNGWGVGVVALEGQVEEGEVLLSIPCSMVIRPEIVFTDPEVGIILQQSSLNNIISIHLYVAYQKVKGKSSRFYDYLSCMPDVPSIPLYFNEETLSIMEPSSAFDKLSWAVQDIYSEFQSLTAMGMFSGILNNITFDSYKWAVSVCISRMYYVDGEPVMLPVGDSLNHSQDSPSFIKDGSKYILHSNCNILKGNEVTISYGPGGPQAYFFHYGFMNIPQSIKTDIGKGLRNLETWWLDVALSPNQEVQIGIIENKEDICILMNDCIPSPDNELTIPEQFAGIITVDAPRTLTILKCISDFGGPQSDLEHYSLSFGLRNETILLDEGSLCALRLLYSLGSESVNWFNATVGKPIGPRSEVSAAAAFCNALKTRLECLASSIATIVKLLNITPDGTSGWKRVGPSPNNASSLRQLGAVLTSETIITQQALEEASLVYKKYERVFTGKPYSIRWK